MADESVSDDAAWAFDVLSTEFQEAKSKKIGKLFGIVLAIVMLVPFHVIVCLLFSSAFLISPAVASFVAVAVQWRAFRAASRKLSDVEQRLQSLGPRDKPRLSSRIGVVDP